MIEAVFMGMYHLGSNILDLRWNSFSPRKENSCLMLAGFAPVVWTAAACLLY
jgi:hypothetical protein